MLRRIGLFSLRAFASACVPHGYQATGLLACSSRYGLVSCARRLAIASLYLPSSKRMAQWASWTTEPPKQTLSSMQAMPTDISLAGHQAFSVVTLLILGSGLALYQMTSLVLGPAGSRQLDLSLSIPTVETHDLAPAASASVVGNLVIPQVLASGSTSAS